MGDVTDPKSIVVPSRFPSMSSCKSEPVAVGLVGCGWIAEIAHVPALVGSRTGHLVAASDPDPARRAWLGARVPGVRLHHGWEALIEDRGVSAVIIALPTALHAEVACRAFAAGKHVYLEKPIALTLDEGRRAVGAWRQAKTVGVIGYNFRRNPIVESARRTLAAGELGSLVAIQGSFHWAAERIEGWRSESGMGGGALLDLVSHHVDLVAAFSGQRIVQVQGTLRSVRSPDDTGALQLLTDNGLVAQLQGSSAAGAPVNRLDLVGTTGVLRVDLLDGRPRPVERAPGPGARLIRARGALGGFHPARLLRSPGFEPSFRASIEAFLEAVRSGVPPRPDLSDGLRALAVIEAAEASARAGGRSVPVPADG